MTHDSEPRGGNFPPIWIAALALVLVTVAFLTTPLTDSRGGFDSDGSIYGIMAGAEGLGDPARGSLAPWCYRILTPFVASLLPLPTLDSFRLLAFVSNVVSLVLLFLLLRRLAFPVRLCTLGVLLYAGVFWTLKFSFYSPAFIDHGTQLFLLLVLYLTVEKQYVVLLPVLALSALQKESLAVYGVWAAVCCVRDCCPAERRRAMAIAAALVAVPVIALVLVRLGIEPINEHSPLVMLEQLRQLRSLQFWPVFAQAVFSGTGVLVMLSLLGAGPAVRLLRNSPEWALNLAISAALLFGGGDKARLFLYLLPVLVILGLQVARSLDRALSRPIFVAWAAAVLLIQAYMGGYLSSMGTFADYLDRFVPVHAEGRFETWLLINSGLALVLAALTLLLKAGAIRARPTVLPTQPGA